jgi:hypothetical protein
MNGAELKNFEDRIIAVVSRHRFGRSPASTIRDKLRMRQTNDNNTVLEAVLKDLCARRLLCVSLERGRRYFRLPPPSITAEDLAAPDDAEGDDEEPFDRTRTEQYAAAKIWRDRMGEARWRDDPRALRDAAGHRKAYLIPPFYNAPMREI